MLALLVPSGVAALAAALAFFGVARTVRQKDRNDHREQWWKRVQWAADLVLSDDDANQQVGMSALKTVIQERKTVDQRDVALLQSIIAVALPGGHSGAGDPDVEQSRTDS